MNNILAVLFIFMVAKIEEVEGSQPEPFRAFVIVDENVERTDFVNNVVQNFPDGSTFDTPILFGSAVSSAFLDNKISKELNANQFKNEAEIVLVFVNNSTILDGEPQFSRKKKTFVVVFGSSVPESWKNVATDENHLFLVTRDSNSSMIERLIKQINFGSQPEPFRAFVIVDENVERTDFVNNVVQNFPDGSTFDTPILFGSAVSSAFLDNKISKELNANQFKNEAEIVFVFVNNSTKLDGEPQFSRKKKTFVVVFGSSVPETWKNVATDENHLFLVTRDSNSSMIMERLIKQINFDVWSKSKEEKLERSSSSTPIPVATYPVKDNKLTVVTVILVIFAVIIIAVIIGVIVIYCIKKRKLRTPSNSYRNVPVSTTHQETEMHTTLM